MKEQPDGYNIELQTYVDEELERRILEIGANLWDHEPIGLAERLQHIVYDDNEAWLLVAEQNNPPRIVGFLVMRKCESLGNTDGTIGDVVVDPQQRRSGIGKLLMQTAEHHLQEQGCESIEFTSQPKRQAAHRLYESLGYKRRDTDVFHKKLV